MVKKLKPPPGPMRVKVESDTSLVSILLLHKMAVVFWLPLFRFYTRQRVVTEDPWGGGGGSEKETTVEECGRTFRGPGWK